MECGLGKPGGNYRILYVMGLACEDDDDDDDDDDSKQDLLSFLLNCYCNSFISLVTIVIVVICRNYVLSLLISLF